jgi:hypothetical protein
MKKSDVFCAKCNAGYLRIELSSRRKTQGEYRCMLCDHAPCQIFKKARGALVGDVVHIVQDPNSANRVAIVLTHKRSKMATLAAVLYRATGIDIDVDTLQRILIFCAGWILFSLLIIIDGLTAFH